MKYLHIYNDTNYCQSDAFESDPNSIALTDEDYEALGKTKKFVNGVLTNMTQEEIERKNNILTLFSQQ